MRAYIRNMLAASLAAMAAWASAAPDSSLVAEWRAGHYKQVLPKLIARWQQSSGRTWQLEYMIGTSECRIDGRREQGTRILEDALANFLLPDEARAAIVKEASECRGATNSGVLQPSLDADPVVAVPVVAEVASVSGKGGYMGLEPPAASDVARTPIRADELARRLPSPPNADESLNAALGRMTGARGAKSAHFAVVSRYLDAHGAAEVAQCLEPYLSTLQSQFQMEAPANIVTIYVGKGVRDVRQLAATLHGVTLPVDTVAYSVVADLSIVGLGKRDACGTLGHELTHLMIRTNFGNSPPWLEEGLASEVAVAAIGGHTFRFSKSWRDDMLNRLWQLRPTVPQLLASDWTRYVAKNGRREGEVAAMHAMAAVFVRYLAEKDQLGTVYVALRDQSFSADLSTRKAPPDLVSAALGATLDQVEADFVRWIRPAGSPTMPVRASATPASAPQDPRIQTDQSAPPQQTAPANTSSPR